MKRFLLFLLLPISAFAQGIFIPAKTVFGTVNGTTRPVPGAVITVCAANTAGIPCAPALAGTVFKDSGLTVPLSNPFFADANGNYPQAALAGGIYTITESAPGFTGFSYQATVACAPGAGCTINILTTGTLSAASINQRCMADQQTGADMGAKIVTCHGILPATGGIIDATGFQGNQVCSTDWASSLTKPVTVLLGNSNLKCNAAQGLTFSSPNITVQGIGNGPAGSGSVISSQGTIHDFIHVTGANVTFKNFRIDTSASACNNVNSVFDDITGTSFTMNGTYVFGGANSDVTVCNAVNLQGNLYYIFGNTFDTIFVVSTFGAIDGQVLQNVWLNAREALYNQTTSHNTIIANNVFQSVAGSGIVAGLDCILINGSGHITIVGNILKACREHGIYVAGSGGTSLPPTNQIDITGNSVANVPGVGIKFHATSSIIPNQQGNLTGNVINCGSQTVGAAGTSAGMQLDQSAGVSITGNTVRYCQTGLDIEGLVYSATIGENVIEYNNASGISLRDAVGALQNITIENNTINNNNVTLGGFGGINVLPDNGGVGGGTNVSTNILIKGNSVHDYQTSFPAQSTTTGGASVTSNVATLTMVNNPISTGLFVNAQAVVSGFTGADTIYNGTFTVTAVTATSISYALVHANVGSTTTGSVTTAATQTTSMAFNAPSNGSAINTVHVLDNQVSNLSSAYAIGAGYTKSYLRHTDTGSPNGAIAIKGWISSTFNRTDGPPWTYCKLTGDGTVAGWGICSPYTITLTAQYTNSTTSFTTVGTPNLSFPVDANQTITATCHLYYQAAATGGLAIQFTGPASPTNVTYGANIPISSTTFGGDSVATAFASTVGNTAVTTATTNFDAIVSFNLVNGANAGTVTLTAASVAAVQLQIQKGSYCQVQ